MSTFVINAPSAGPEWLTPVISAVAVLGGALVGGLLTARVSNRRAAVDAAIAKDRVRVDIITAGRQRWIEALRDDLALLFSNRLALDRHEAYLQKKLSSEAARLEGLNLRREVSIVRARVLLRLDEKVKAGKPENQRLLAVAVRMLSDSSTSQSDGLQEAYIRLGQEVIDAAWEQVKKEAAGNV